MKTCPTCGRPIPEPNRPKKVCWRCRRPIGRHDKWIFDDDSRPVHRNCEDPRGYPQEATAAPETGQQELPEGRPGLSPFEFPGARGG